jgi:maleylacetate reductase
MTEAWPGDEHRPPPRDLGAPWYGLPEQLFDGFDYTSQPMRVSFGAGKVRQLAAEVDYLGLTRVLVVSTPGGRAMAEEVADALGDRAVGVLAEAAQHVPVEVAQRARQAARHAGADGCVAVGGGSTIGLGKAIALEDGLPVLAVPTTYAGSEMTPVWGLTEGGVKRTGRDGRVLPRGVVYDPELTFSLPVVTSVTSGINAIAHAAEALYAPDASPIISLMAEEGVRAMVDALPAIAARPEHPAGRTGALYAAWLCGACLGATTMSLHHRLCHALGGTLGLPHAETHTVVLPQVLRYNLPAAPSAMAALCRAIDTDDPPTTLQDMLAPIGVPDSLRALGVARSDLAGIAEQVLASPYANPRPVTREGLDEVLLAAWAGQWSL